MYVRQGSRILPEGLKRLERVHLRTWIVPALLLALAAGCAAVRVPDDPPEPTPTHPIWSEDELRDHIQFLNGEDLSGRATGTQGYARAAAYVAARMREFRLQPAVEGEYRMVYGVSLNYPVSATIRAVGLQDSVSYLPGVDFLPDARTDAGTARLSRFVVASDSPDGAVPPFGVIVPPGEPPNLRAWREAGARLAIVMTDLRPRFQPAPIADLLTVQMTQAAVARLLNVAPAEVLSVLQSRRGASFRVDRQLFVDIATDYQPQAGAINMMGYYSGKHPVRQSELVIVCADLDAVGHFAGVPAFDFSNFGISTAAVLEVARNLGFVTHRWRVPERSVMVAIWSGSQTEHGGLRYFLQQPTWALEDIVSVVYVGLTPEEERDVRRILDEYGIPLTAIPAMQTPLYERDVVLRPDPAVLRMARNRGGDVPDVELPDESAIIDSAVVRARRLADRAYSRTLVHATDSASFFPAREDTLPTPQAAGSALE